MKTFTTLRNTTAKFCNVSTSDTIKMALIDSNVNDSIRTMCNLHGGKLRFLETTKDMATVASQEAYQIPNSFRKLIDMYIYSGTGASTDTIYTPEMVFDPTKWKRVKQARYGSQDVPYFSYVEGRKFLLQPIPETSGNLITLRGRLNTRDLTIADYTTGSIVSVANAGVAVIGTGTFWTADMAGRYIQITETTADNGGDGFWYEIASVTDTTHLTLLKPYEGVAIAAATAAYTIGQVSAIPEAYDIGICYRSAALYWDNNNDLARAKSYWLKYDGGNEAGFTTNYGGIVGQMIVTEGETEEGSYIPPFGSESTFPSQDGPYYWPRQDASGF
jgi:hypothetical protein